MAGSLNRVELIGNLGKDPEIRNFQDGGRIATFSVACSESWKDKGTGEKREKTEWINVSVRNDGLVGICEKYLTKGSKVFIAGKFSTRKWQDQSGQDRWSSEVVIQGFGGQIIMLGGSQGGAQAHEEKAAGGYANELDDEIPF